ncbi:hypothetical protein HKD37_18G050712 [Glycine soja]
MNNPQLYNRDAQTLTIVSYFRKIFMLYVQREVIIIHPNTLASHYMCNDLRKSCGMVNVIRYEGSTSGSDISTGFVGPSTSCLSYIVNKH